MSDVLVNGQNRHLSGMQVEVDASCLPVGFALAAIPLGTAPDRPFQGAVDERVPYLSPTTAGRYEIDLSAVGAGTESISLAAYSVRHERTMREVPDPSFAVDGARMAPGADAVRFPAVIFARLYRNSGAWKLRAMCEGSTRGLADLGRLIGRTLDEGGPPAPLPPGLPSAGSGPGGRPDWTGTGFLVAPGLLLTNAHVVQRARSLLVAGYEGRSAAEPVIVDENCDLALVRVDRTIGGVPLPFRLGAGPELGETAIAMGYPLAGFLGSGPQVAQGTVSGLLGPSEDSRVIQITTPIQGGSSGGPVLDLKGRVIGVVTATLSGQQNVNFAVRGCLAQALIEAAGRTVALVGEAPDLDIATVARNVRDSVWRLEASQ